MGGSIEGGDGDGDVMGMVMIVGIVMVLVMVMEKCVRMAWRGEIIA